MRLSKFYEMVRETQGVNWDFTYSTEKTKIAGWYSAVLKGTVLSDNGMTCEVTIDTERVHRSDERDKIINGFVELMNTPPEEWYEPKRYIFPLPGLTTTDGEQQYLTQRGKHWFACRRNKDLRQTWKEEHIKWIPKEYRHLKTEVEDAI
ncbi:hypothetical protein [Aedoeadaptatus coxii]|uniref:hypothetical protein n=1 Tax=Aedoeadaptatus coxii TaxID=755172 RepID=UPI002AD2ACD7|nr:hypothetical protein [Peptoniphilus coxii]